MAFSPNQKYPGATDPNPNYKDGVFRDNSPATTNNGSPLKALDRNEQLSLQEAIMNAAGFNYNGIADTPQASQMFDAYKAALSNGANLISNHNFLVQSPDDSQPLPDATPRTYPPGFQIFSGVFANETTGILNLTYINGRVSFSGGDFYMPVPNTGGVERLTEFVASVADFDGKPRTRGVSYALVGDEYRITVGVDALEDVAANPTPLGSVKFEQGSVATGHFATPIEDMLVVDDVITTTVKDRFLGGKRALMSYAYSSIFDGGSGVWIATGNTVPLKAGQPHVVGSVYLYDRYGVEFKNLEQQFHCVGIMPSDTVDQTLAIQLFFSEVDAGMVVSPASGNYIVDIGSLAAPLTDGTDASRAAVLLSKPVTIKGQGVFKALDGSGLVANNNYFFATAVNGCRFRGANFNGNRLNVNSSYGIQINNNDTIVTDWCQFKTLDGSPVVVNGVIPASPLTDIIIPNNIAEDCGNTVFVGYCQDIQGGYWKVRNASEGLDLDKRTVGGNFDGWVISLKRGAGADAALEINGGRGIQANGWTSRDFVTGILINGKNIGGTDYRSENCSAQNHTIINPTGHAITVGNVLGNDDDAIDCNCDGYTIINSTQASLATRGKNCSFRNGVIRDSQREGVIHQGGTCDYSGTKVINAARSGLVNNGGYANFENTFISGAGQELTATYNAALFNDTTSGSVIGMRVNGSEHTFALRAMGNVNIKFDNVDFSGGTESDSVNLSSGTELFNTKATASGGLDFHNSAREFQANEAFSPGGSFAPVVGDIIYHTDNDPSYRGRRWNGSIWRQFGAFV